MMTIRSPHIYKYETHLHTSEASACATSSAEEYVELYSSLGYAGIIVTDHFFNGNCVIPSDLPWREKVERFCLGYEHAKVAGDRKGLNVMFGWESNYGNDEYLVYGLDKEWLLDHPEVMEWDQKQQFENVHRYGGIVVQCHPFRIRDYVKDIKIHCSHVDAIEVSNAGNPYWQDQLAYALARENALVCTAGSDIHNVDKIKEPQGLFGVSFEEPLTDITDYVRRVASGRQPGLLTEDRRLQLPTDAISIDLPLYTYDYENRQTRTSLRELFRQPWN